MPYKVFTDFHHGSLLQSLILLFEKRLGGMVYRPIGLEWFEQGFWKINDQQDTAEQFLGYGSVPKDGTPKLNEIEQSINDEIFIVKDSIDGENKSVTLPTFYSIPIDLVIASIPQHIEPFRRLCELHPNKPKLIYQIGNQWTISPEQTKMIDAVMASALVLPTPEQHGNAGIPMIIYHQEFDLDIFRPDRLTLTDMENGERVLTHPAKNIYSFINILQNHQDYGVFLDIEHHLPDWQLRSFGGQCRDGNMNGALDLARKMREARFVWHTKSGGDGYGHILHNAAAIGRPVIVRREDYRGKLGDRLLIKDETCIEIDGLTPSQIVDKIRYFSDPERYMDMSRAVYWNFQRVVDFDQEQKEIESFLSSFM